MTVRLYTAEEALELLFDLPFLESVMNDGQLDVPNPLNSTQAEGFDFDYAQSICNLSRVEDKLLQETPLKESIEIDFQMPNGMENVTEDNSLNVNTLSKAKQYLNVTDPCFTNTRKRKCDPEEWC